MGGLNTSPNMRPTPFGKEMREKHFLFAKGHVNLNHGSFGGHPREIRDVMRHYQDKAEAEPDRFIRYVFPPKLREARSLAARMLNCPMDEIVLLPNVTTATNTVLRNLQYAPGDKIVYLSGAYGALEKTIEYTVETTAAEGVKIEYELPMEDDALLGMFEETLEKHRGHVKLAVFDSIVSMPGVRLPFERMAQVCRDEGVLSMIDAAHGVGHIALDLTALDPDFLVTNCHKWLYVPRSVAIFYVAHRSQHLIRSTLPTSHGFAPKPRPGVPVPYDPMPASAEANPLIKQYEYFGTIDNGPYLCLEAAIRFRDEVCGGEERIRNYCTELAAWGERRLVEMLGTETLPNIPESKRVFFAHVKLPLMVQGGKEDNESQKAGVSKADVPLVTEFLNHKFVDEYHTYMYVLFYRGAWWVRISATVYLDMDDMEFAGRVLLELCERVRKGEYRDFTP